MAPKDMIFENWSKGRQTFIIPLTFPDINAAKDVIARIGYGGDIWELRVDLLTPDGGTAPLGDENLPKLNYVRSQVQYLQAMSPLPILFTIRTRSQGGKFPDGAHKEALDLMLLAVESGVAYIDVEIEWPECLIQEITSKKGAAKIVASYHSWTGKISWTSQELQDRFVDSNRFGDIVKLSILSASIEDTYELGLFLRDCRAKYVKPALVVGMGPNGQLSRITSPISLVTHPLIPFPSAPGQLSLAQVHQGQHLIGQLPAQDFYVTGGPGAHKVVRAFQLAFDELRFPYRCKMVEADAEVDGAFNTDTSGLEDVTRLASQFTLWTGRDVAPLTVLKNALV